MMNKPINNSLAVAIVAAAATMLFAANMVSRAHTGVGNATDPHRGC